MKKFLTFLAIFLVLMGFMLLCRWVEGVDIWHRGAGQGFTLFVAVTLAGLVASFFSDV